jgi:hypothetical protein
MPFIHVCNLPHGCTDERGWLLLAWKDKNLWLLLLHSHSTQEETALSCLNLQPAALHRHKGKNETSILLFIQHYFTERREKITFYKRPSYQEDM